MNSVTLLGRLGREPDEVKYFQNGTPYTSFSLATTRSWRDKAGERQEKTEWHNISVIGKIAEVCKKYLMKGSQVLVQGEINYETFENEKGKQYITKIKADTITFTGDKKDIGNKVEIKVQPETYDDIPF
jgi:single-strand DNA-binding protein